MASSAILAGGILLRQMRVKSRTCGHDIASVGVTSCAPPYSELDEEQEFKPWSGQQLSKELLVLPEYSWKSADTSGDVASQGMPASGFTLRLATALDTASAIERLKKSNWIDTKTRGIFVTGCFYNNVAKMIACSRTAVIVGTTGLYESIQSIFDFEIDRTSIATSRGLQIFVVQAVLFAITIVMLMQESTKLVLYSVSAYVRDGTNIRRVSACVLYIGGVLFALYRETGVDRAVTEENPIPMLVSISDSRIAGLYAEAVAALFMWFEAIHLLRINETFSRIVGAIWSIFFEIVAICSLVLVLVVAFATCLTVSMSRSDPLFATFGTSSETMLRLLFGDTLPYSSFYNSSSPLESSSRFKLMMYILWKLCASVIVLNIVLGIVIKSYFSAIGFSVGASASAGDTVANLIASADQNNDGLLDQDEFKKLMGSKYGSDEDVRAAFNKFDVNNDGVLDRAEMEAVQQEIESHAMKKNKGADQRHGVSSEVLEAQVERIETFVIAVHGSCNALHDALAQNTASIKGVMKEIQALNANMQLLQTRMVKLGSGASDEGSVKSKMRARVGQAAKGHVKDEEVSP